MPLQIVLGGLHWASTVQLAPVEPLLEEVVTDPLDPVAPPELELPLEAVGEPVDELEVAAGHRHEPLTVLQVYGAHWVFEAHWAVESHRPVPGLQNALAH